MMKFIISIILIFVAIMWGFLLEGILRKLAARMQNRIGPPPLQPFFDFMKLLQKETITPKNSNEVFMNVGLVISFLSVLSILFFLPEFGFLTFEYDIIFIIYLLIACIIGFCLVGFGSNNPYSSLGSIREIVMLFSIEPVLIISLITAGMLTNFSIINSELFLTIPFAFFAFLLATAGELKIPPFHIPEAEQELVSGTFTEITGKRLALFRLIYSLRIFIFTAIISILFLGGGNIFIILAKTLVIIFLLSFFRVLFARLRMDQGLKIFWFAIFIALIDFIRVWLL